MCLHFHLSRAVAAGMALVAATAWADEAGVPGAVEPDISPRNYANLRVGASTSSYHPTYCLEVAPLEMLSVDACGTGSGFFHHGTKPEIAHFRAWMKLTSWKTSFGWLQPRLGAGFAELQVGEDSGGFHFTQPGPLARETAGPEVGASLRLLTPLKAGIEFVGEAAVNTMYFHYAPRLIQPQSAFQPGASLSVGIGF